MNPAPHKDRFTRRAAKIFADLAFRTGQGMAGAMCNRRFSVDEDALEHWLEHHTDTIGRAVEDYERNWEIDKGTARMMAKLLGATAAHLALIDAAGSPEQAVTVTIDHVRAASERIHNDRRCRPLERRGGGEYCG